MLKNILFVCAVMLLPSSILADEYTAGIEHNNLPKSQPTASDTDRNPCQRTMGVVGISSAYADKMLNWQEHVTGKQLQILKAKQGCGLSEQKLYVSGMFKGSMMIEQTNKPGKFYILSHFGPGSDDKSASTFFLNNAAMAFTATPFDWVTTYTQLEYTEIPYPDQDNLQMRKAYVVLGNLDRSPLYAFFGRKTVDFGDLETYTPFTHGIGNHLWRVDSDAPVAGAGYTAHGLHVVATAIPGGRHLRVADSPETGKINNFAVNAQQSLAIRNNITFKIGGSYLHNTIYNAPLAHHPHNSGSATGKIDNPAYGGFAALETSVFDMKAEYLESANIWPATDGRVKSLQIQGRYKFDYRGMPTVLSAVYGVGFMGPENTEHHKMQQIHVGLEMDVATGISFGAEYVRNLGHTPLIDIVNASDSDVINDSLILGLRVAY